MSSTRDLRALESRLGAIEHVKGVAPRVDVLERPFCDVVDLLGPFGLSAKAARKGPAITVNSPTLSFREGDLLVVERDGRARGQGLSLRRLPGPRRDLRPHAAEPLEHRGIFARQIAQETGLKVVTDLHLESLTDGPPAGTYIDMMKYNVTQIVNGLK